MVIFMMLEGKVCLWCGYMNIREWSLEIFICEIWKKKCDSSFTEY